MAEILHDIPIPPPRHAKEEGLCADMRRMGIGDSSFHATNRRSVLFSCAKYVGIKITTRKSDGGFTFWRKA